MNKRTCWFSLLYLLSLLVCAAKWPTSPPDLQLHSWNKASFSRLTADIRFWKSCSTDHLSNLSKKWVICQRADQFGGTMCLTWPGLDDTESVKTTVRQQTNSFQIHQQVTVTVKFQFFQEVKSKSVHYYKTTEWYLMLARSCWALMCSGNRDRGAVVDSEQLGLCIYKNS